MTGHVLQPGRVDQRGLTNLVWSRSVKVNGERSTRVSEDVNPEKADDYFYTCMEGSRVSTRQGAFTFEIHFSCSRRSRTAMPMNRRRFTSIRRRRAPKRLLGYFAGHTRITPQVGAVVAAFPGEYEQFHRRRTQAQAPRSPRPLKSSHLSVRGTFAEYIV